jgi:hypothetical protein
LRVEPDVYLSLLILLTPCTVSSLDSMAWALLRVHMQYRLAGHYDMHMQYSYSARTYSYSVLEYIQHHTSLGDCQGLRACAPFYGPLRAVTPNTVAGSSWISSGVQRYVSYCMYLRTPFTRRHGDVGSSTFWAWRGAIWRFAGVASVPGVWSLEASSTCTCTRGGSFFASQDFTRSESQICSNGIGQ